MNNTQTASREILTKMTLKILPTSESSGGTSYLQSKGHTQWPAMQGASERHRGPTTVSILVCWATLPKHHSPVGLGRCGS